MSSSQFSKILLDSRYLMLFATLCEGRRWKGGLFFLVFLAGLEGAEGGNEKVCVTNWGKGRGGKLCGNEERRGDEGTAEGGKSVKKCRAEGFGRAESALMQTLWGASRTHTHTDAHTRTHTHTHTHTHTPVHSHPARFAVAPLQISSISGCHTG